MAKLDSGDCLTCALAEAKGEPALFEGDGFGRTDVAQAAAGHAPSDAAN